MTRLPAPSPQPHRAPHPTAAGPSAPPGRRCWCRSWAPAARCAPTLPPTWALPRRARPTCLSCLSRTARRRRCRSCSCTRGPPPACKAPSVRERGPRGTGAPTTGRRLGHSVRPSSVGRVYGSVRPAGGDGATWTRPRPQGATLCSPRPRHAAPPRPPAGTGYQPFPLTTPATGDARGMVNVLARLELSGCAGWCRVGGQASDHCPIRKFGVGEWAAVRWMSVVRHACGSPAGLLRARSPAPSPAPPTRCCLQGIHVPLGLQESRRAGQRDRLRQLVRTQACAPSKPPAGQRAARTRFNASKRPAHPNFSCQSLERRQQPHARCQGNLRPMAVPTQLLPSRSYRQVCDARLLWLPRPCAHGATPAGRRRQRH